MVTPGNENGGDELSVTTFSSESGRYSLLKRIQGTLSSSLRISTDFIVEVSDDDAVCFQNLSGGNVRVGFVRVLSEDYRSIQGGVTLKNNARVKMYVDRTDDGNHVFYTLTAFDLDGRASIWNKPTNNFVSEKTDGTKYEFGSASEFGGFCVMAPGVGTDSYVEPVATNADCAFYKENGF